MRLDLHRELAPQNITVNKKRVRRVMRLMGLEAIHHKPRPPVKSGETPGHAVYPYLLKGLTIDRPDQVGCTDMTYIPMPCGWIYWGAIMDWCSRHGLSWELSNTLDASFCVSALKRALA
jgi:putative transposase